MQAILNEILKSQAHIVAGTLVLWTVIGALGGVLLAIAATALLSMAGAFRLEWRHAAWVRVPTYMLVAIAFGVLGGMIGGCEGALHGVERVVRQSQFRTELLDRGGTACAVGLYGIDLCLANAEAGRKGGLTDAQEADWDAFVRGERELNVPDFLRRLQEAEGRVVQEAVGAAKARLREHVNVPKAPLVESLLDSALAFVMRKALREKLTEALAGQDVDLSKFFLTLPAAARARGDGNGITCQELADHVVEKAFIPAILGPTRKWLRAHQVVYALLMLASLLVAVIGFWIGRFIGRRAGAGSPPPIEASPPSAPSPSTQAP